MIDAIGERARAAARRLARTTTESKNAALLAMASRLESEADAVLEANGRTWPGRRRTGSPRRSSTDSVSTDPGWRRWRPDFGLSPLFPIRWVRSPRGGGLPNGLEVSRIRVPLGVVAVIYEARPNVTVDAAGLCLKSGNAALLRGSSTALRSNLAIGEALRAGLADADIPEDAVQVLEDTSREGARELLRAKRWVDLLVPRGGPGLLAQIEAEATVPVVDRRCRATATSTWMRPPISTRRFRWWSTPRPTAPACATPPRSSSSTSRWLRSSSHGWPRSWVTPESSCAATPGQGRSSPRWFRRPTRTGTPSTSTW